MSRVMAVAWSLMASGPAWAGSVEPWTSPVVPENKVAAAPLSSTLDALVPQCVVALDEVDPTALQQTRSTWKGGMQIGTVRGVPKAQALVLDGTTANWTKAPDGSLLWVAMINSPSATGIRLHLTNLALPPGASVSIFDPSNPAEMAGPYTSGWRKGRAELWTGSVLADTVALEVRLEPGVDPSMVQLTVPSVGHFFDQNPIGLKEAGSCNIDIRCQASSWQQLGTGVGRYSFIDGDYIYSCTGSLLNDSRSSGALYFYTANHCVSSSDVAETVEVLWRYRTASCNGSVPSETSLDYSEGSELLATSESSDSTLLLLDEAAPGGTTFLGWDTNAITTGGTVYAIHHPRGEYQRWSQGNLIANSSNYWSVRWSLGTTEQGSSGSPLLMSDGKVRGNLSNGSASCTNTSGTDNYGRFNAFYSSISEWLSPTTAAPNNDNFPGITLTGSTGTAAGTTVGATRQSSEPAHLGNISSGSVWYSWQAPATGTVTIDTCSAASYDTILAVYTGSGFPLTFVASSDDDCSAGSTRSRVRITASQGTTYRIAVAGYQNASGTFTLSYAQQAAVTPAPLVETPENITASSFQLQWSPVSAASGYYLDVSTASSFTSFLSGYNNLAVGLGTGRTITGLASNRTYYVRMRAVGPNGTSANSNVVSATTLVAGVQPLSSTWYFAEGATSAPFQTFILMANPASGTRTVRMELLREGAPSQSHIFTLAANSRQTVELNSLVAPGGVSTVLTEVNGLGFAAERAMYVLTGNTGRWNAAHAAVGVTSTEREWFFAEGATVPVTPGRQFQTFILLANPNSTSVTADVTYYPEGSSSFTETVTLPPTSRTTLEPGTRFAALASASFSTRVQATSGGGILAERAMWWGDSDWTANAFMGGHASPGLSGLSTSWYFAEGNTTNQDDFILFVNPSNVGTEVRLDYLLTGSSTSRSFYLPPNSRRTVNVTYDNEGIGSGARHGTVIASDVPIPFERSIYWSRGRFAWVDGTNALAAPLPSYSWLLPEGATVPITYGVLSTEILVANPNSASVTVNFRFLVEGRSPVTRTVTLGGRRCMTFAAADVPELQGVGFATEVTANLPIVVERSMYMDTDTPEVIERVAGTCSMGIPREPAIPSVTGVTSLGGRLNPQLDTAAPVIPTPTPTPTVTPLRP